MVGWVLLDVILNIFPERYVPWAVAGCVLLGWGASLVWELLDTRRGKDLMGTFLSDIVLQVLSFVAENERTNIRQRQAEGIAAAKARGVKFGRPPRPLPDNFYEVHKAWRDKKLTLKEAAEACDLPVGTFYGKSIQFEKST